MPVEINPTEVSQPQVEVEPFPHFRILLLGAGSGLGKVLAQRFAREGYQVIAGTRSEAKFEDLCRSITDDGGIEPQPFIADITQPDKLIDAYNSLHLNLQEKVHYMPVAAGGLEAVKMGIARQLITLKRVGRTETGITRELVEQATAAVKALTTSSEAMIPAMDINYTAPLRIFDLLKNGGHLGSGSMVLNISSSISNVCDPDNPQVYPGPWFYYTIGMSKERGVRALRERAAEVDVSHIDVVAPEIFDTGVGKFIDELVKVIQAIDPNSTINVPIVSRADVVEAVFAELTRKDDGLPKMRTVYVTNIGVSYQRPTVWDKPLLPYL